ncbi:hypothetical protein TIFTF001_012240 [Ficus carica]|uniref:Uncharacterized protein n=1 Tax=Ficus carica TaxID=3494 RepID=A0AA87ZVM6_FICCA|nr:hypothetical protein TIFTF001_012240 [Ficus carica]
MDIVADRGRGKFAMHPESSVTVVVYEFYANAYNSRNMRITDIVADRGWGKFAMHPESSITIVVYEFYADAYSSRDEVIYVIGKWVPISQTIINEYYGLHDIERDDYQRYLENVDIDEIKSSISVVIWEGHEIWEGPRHPIDDGVIASYKEGDDDDEDKPPQPHRPVSTMSVPQHWEYVDDRLGHIEENQCNLVDML